MGFHGRKIGDELIATNIVWPINNRLAEINVTDNCNLRCPNCQAHCNLLPEENYIELAYVEQMVSDAIRLNLSLDKLKLTGGEPTMHPRLLEIIGLLGPYHAFHPNCQIKILTNGTPAACRKLEGLPSWCIPQVQNTVQRGVWNIFESVHVAPIDLPEYQNLDKKVFGQGCCRTTICAGIAMGTNGRYYPCDMIYHIDRVFGLQLGLSSLEEYLAVPESVLRKMMEQACCLCGYFKYPRDIVGKETLSPTWVNAFESRKGIKLL